jgi:KTSC domain
MASHRFDGFTKIKGSGHLDGVKYSSMDKKMTVRFSNGYQYIVHGLSPDGYQAFMDAPSHGEHYHQHIIPNHHIERVR